MKARTSLYLTFASLVAIAGLLIGCTRTRTDAAIAQDVQNKLLLDQAISTKQISVASDHGVVTLSGTVPSQQERDTAAADAGKIEGVKTVVNNLTAGAQTAAAAPAPEAQPAPQEEPAPTREPERPSRRPSAYHSSSSRAASGPRTPVSSVPSGGFGNTPPPAESRDLSQNTSSVPAPAVAPPPPVPVNVTVPDGTELQVRLDESLSSNKNHQGDVFHGTLDQPVVLNDQTVIPAYAEVTGRVTEAVAANRLTGQPSLALEVTRLSYNGHSYNLSSDPFRRTGTSRGKRNVKTGAGGAALGAIIGAIAGGGKGAAIGAATGAGAGTAAGAATGSDDVRLDSESIVSFRLQAPVTVTPAKSTMRRAAGNPDGPPPPPQNDDYRDNSPRDNSSNDSTDRPVLQRHPQSQQPPDVQ